MNKIVIRLIVIRAHVKRICNRLQIPNTVLTNCKRNTFQTLFVYDQMRVYLWFSWFSLRHMTPVSNYHRWFVGVHIGLTITRTLVSFLDVFISLDRSHTAHCVCAMDDTCLTLLENFFFLVPYSRRTRWK